MFCRQRQRLKRWRSMSEVAQTVTSPKGKVLSHRGSHKTTPRESAEAKAVRIKTAQADRLEKNKKSLENKNVKAFLQAIAEAEGGGYDFKYGAVKGKKNDPWRFSDFSTHPGAGFGGSTTASGMYQITKDTWQDHGINAMGLTDFKPDTQDLIAVDMLDSMGALDKIKDGDVAGAMPMAARKWAALPQGPGLANRYPPQPYVTYEKFIQSYAAFGGQTK
jgi:muramidase (phage lysozyme)